MFDLWPKISIPETEFLEKHKISTEQWTSLRTYYFNKNCNCSGCGIHNSERKISLHVIEENIEVPLKSQVTLLCLDCHFIAHIDKAIKKKYVTKLVNSIFTQGELVSICRNKRLKSQIDAGNIMLLDIEPESFLEKLDSGLQKGNRIKAIFSPQNYKWD